MFIIGSIGNELPDIDAGLEALVRPTNSRKVGTALAKAKVLGEVIADLEGEPGPCMEYSPNMAKVFERIPAGKNWRYIRDSQLFSQQELEEFMGGAYSSTGGEVRVNLRQEIV